MLCDRVVQAPNLDGVEPELRCVLRAISDFIFVVVKVASAVVPEGDMIEVFDVEGIFSNVGGLLDDGICQGVMRDVEIGQIGGVDPDVGRVCPEEVQVVEIVIFSIRATHSDDDQANERSDGQPHGRENTRKTASLAHDEVC